MPPTGSLQAGELPLPRKFVNHLNTVTYRDFTFDTSEGDDDHYQDGLYPAICLIDASKVAISVSHRAGEMLCFDQSKFKNLHFSNYSFLPKFWKSRFIISETHAIIMRFCCNPS